MYVIEWTRTQWMFARVIRTVTSVDRRIYVRNWRWARRAQLRRIEGRQGK